MKGTVIALVVAQLAAAEAADPAATEAARREEELQKLRAELEDTAVEVLPLQRAMVVQGSHECPDDGTPGTLVLQRVLLGHEQARRAARHQEHRRTAV